MDTGVDGTHPDLATELRPRAVTQLHHRHARHRRRRASTPAASTRSTRTTTATARHAPARWRPRSTAWASSGVAPNVTLVNIRAGQDSGYFFLSATANALTYGGDAGLDVVNMSFYVDPWLYNCKGGAPEDTPEQAAEQDVIIEAMNRALDYAHRKGVTLVAALGNKHTRTSPTRGPTTRARTTRPAPSTTATIDNANCLSTCRSRARTSSVSRRSARPGARPTTPTGPATSPPVSSRSRPPVAGSATASARPPTAPTATSSSSTAPLNVLQAERGRRRRRQHHPAGRRRRHHEGLRHGEGQGGLRVLPVPAGHLDGVTARRRRRRAGGVGQGSLEGKGRASA